jgi:hypothetical protein
MPDEPRISVHDYVHDYLEARLQWFEERFQRLLDDGLRSLRGRIDEVIGWMLLASSASWGNFAGREDASDRLSALITIGMAAVGLVIIVRHRRR